MMFLLANRWKRGSLPLVCCILAACAGEPRLEIPVDEVDSDQSDHPEVAVAKSATTSELSDEADQSANKIAQPQANAEPENLPPPPASLAISIAPAQQDEIAAELPLVKTAASPSASLTFSDALTLADINSNRIIDGRRAIDRASDRQQELQASYASDVLLRLVGNSDQGLDSTAFRDEEDNRAGSEEVGAELRWTPPWWHKRTVLIDAERAGLDRRVAEVQAEESRLDLGLEIYRRYLTVLLQVARLNISSESLSAVETRYRATADSQALGLASPLNALLDEANVSNQKAEVAADVSQLNDDLNSLYQALGVSYDGAALCGNYFAYGEYTGEAGDPHVAAVQQANSIELEIAKEKLEKSQYEEIWLPRLSVMGSYAHGFDQRGSEEDDVGSVGLELAIPLPNFEMARLQQQSSASELSYLQSRMAKSVAETERRIRDMQAAIQTSKGKLKLREEAVAKQRERIIALREGLEIGQITRAELEILEDAAKSTILAYVDSLFGHLMRIAELNRQYGKLPHVPESCEALDVLASVR